MYKLVGKVFATTFVHRTTDGKLKLAAHPKNIVFRLHEMTFNFNIIYENSCSLLLLSQQKGQLLRAE